jgi:hypothetical protein
VPPFCAIAYTQVRGCSTRTRVARFFSAFCRCDVNLSADTAQCTEVKASVYGASGSPRVIREAEHRTLTERMIPAPRFVVPEKARSSIAAKSTKFCT